MPLLLDLEQRVYTNGLPQKMPDMYDEVRKGEFYYKIKVLTGCKFLSDALEHQFTRMIIENLWSDVIFIM